MLKRILFTIQFLLIISFCYSQDRNKHIILDTTSVKLSDYFTDTINEVKEKLLLEAIANRDSFLIEYEYDIENVFVYDFNQDGYLDIIHSGHYMYYNGYITDILINKITSYKSLGIFGRITYLEFDKEKRIKLLSSYREDCCNSPFNEIYTYKFDWKNDTMYKEENYKIPKPVLNEKFELPDSIFSENSEFILGDSTKLYPNSNGKEGAYFENQFYISAGQKLEIIGEKNEYVLVILQVKVSYIDNEFQAIGWIKKSKLKSASQN